MHLDIDHNECTPVKQVLKHILVILQGLSQSGNTEIKLFSGLQHAHLLAREIRTRHFRNGTEIDPIMDDRNYDFNFQEMRMLPNEVTVKAVS